MRTYEELKQGIEEGTIKAPVVSFDNKNIEYTKYILATHKYSLGILASGMTLNNIKLKHLKEYYALKGRSAKDCYQEFCAKYF